MQGFVHPALAFGALLAVVPLIIHLLNRRRHKPLRWGAMRFVEAAYKKTRRRMQLENLLLLLLRMAAVAALAFAVARPFVGRGALGALTETSRDLVLLLDASASTAYREDIDTIFDRIVRRAEALVGDLKPTRGDRVHVLLLGSQARLIAWPTPDKALSVLSTLDHPLDEPMDLAAGFAELERLVTDGEILDIGQTEVRLLTDLQRVSFVTPGDGTDPPPYIAQLDSLQAQGLKVWVEDLGPASSTPPNLSVDSLLIDGSQRGPKEVAVTVINHTNLPQAGVRVSLTLDGNRLPSQRVDLEPRSESQAVFALGGLEPGPHSLVASTEGDRLPIDDSRARVALVPRPVRVLLVNGSPSDDLEDDGVGYLRLALEQDASGDAPSPFAVTTIRAGELPTKEAELNQFDVIWLAGMPAPSPKLVTALENRVLEGAALIVSAGPQLGDAGTYNARMFRPDGTGLLPGELLGRISIARQGDFYRIEQFDEQHPAFSIFADARVRPLLIGVPFSDFQAMAPEPGAKVLARLDDQGKSPLLVEKALGRGRSLYWASSINEDWTLLPRAGRTFVPFVY
ncbi:MAG TPA: BatA domain-containing protein, partial [Planctomycetota bacterium]|nr:BatA domain-containing protein [Planctomycetota bacterium]